MALPLFPLPHPVSSLCLLASPAACPDSSSTLPGSPTSTSWLAIGHSAVTWTNHNNISSHSVQMSCITERHLYVFKFNLLTPFRSMYIFRDDYFSLEKTDSPSQQPWIVCGSSSRGRALWDCSGMSGNVNVWVLFKQLIDKISWVQFCYLI